MRHGRTIASAFVVSLLLHTGCGGRDPRDRETVAEPLRLQARSVEMISSMTFGAMPQPMVVVRVSAFVELPPQPSADGEVLSRLPIVRRVFCDGIEVRGADQDASPAAHARRHPTFQRIGELGGSTHVAVELPLAPLGARTYSLVEGDLEVRLADPEAPLLSLDAKEIRAPQRLTAEGFPDGAVSIERFDGRHLTILVDNDHADLLTRVEAFDAAGNRVSGSLASTPGKKATTCFLALQKPPARIVLHLRGAARIVRTQFVLENVPVPPRTNAEHERWQERLD